MFSSATTLVRLRPRGMSADDLKQALLRVDPPLIGRIERDAFCLDPRTLADAELPLAVAALRQALDEE